VRPFGPIPWAERDPQNGQTSELRCLSAVGACRFFANDRTDEPTPETTVPKAAPAYAGYTDKMRPKPDHGEESYRGPGTLTGKRAVITGADSGIGRAVAIAYAREGADVLISYLSEHEDAKETRRLIGARSSIRLFRNSAASLFSSATRPIRRPSNHI
jgi:hypothetical protein